MGDVVITACRSTGVSGLILVPNSPGPGLSYVSALLSSKLNMEEYLQTTEICIGVPWNLPNKSVFAGWVGDLGALNFYWAQ